MSLKISNKILQEWVVSMKDKVVPWSSFINVSKFKIPKTISPFGKRIVKNIEKFQGNYIFVFFGLVLFCILTSPLLLIGIGVCVGACYVVNVRNNETPLRLMGRQISLAHQYAAIATFSFPLFWIAGAGSAVFWVIGASFVLIICHAAFYSLEDELDEVPDLEGIQTV
ncbi:DgyrCDS6025 [Dimorphilus gyrociliatus]|uniref:PRA1 family protein n=1 Tax=Dimorphilus gyrociliatus TaxID=2664684 RepID=A0A7I8VMI7_9ANNE|nr:DgyrCDS6025 [Dimorphilus gyrociliatus]